MLEHQCCLSAMSSLGDLSTKPHTSCRLLLILLEFASLLQLLPPVGWPCTALQYHSSCIKEDLPPASWLKTITTADISWVIMPAPAAPCAHLEEVITGHARLTGHTSWDDDHVAALQSSLQLCITLKTLQAQPIASIYYCLETAAQQQH